MKKGFSMDAVSYHDYELPVASRRRENIEWSIAYAFNAPDESSPRVFFIGDSICNGYKDSLREKLGDRINLSFWASSKCVTDPEYLRELDLLLDSRPCSMIAFNNGLHSLNSNRAEWIAAYDNVLAFLRAKRPDSLLVVLLCTPVANDRKNEIVRELNHLASGLAEKRNLSVFDLYSPMDRLNRATYWRDEFHFTPEAVQMQSSLLETWITQTLPPEKLKNRLRQHSSLTGPDGKMD